MIMTLVFGIAFIAAVFATVTGFGSATILTPFMGLAIPVKQAIILVAFFHCASNVSKTGFFKKSIDRRLLLIYGLPSLAASYAGARLLYFFDARLISFIFAIFIIAYSVYSLFNLKINIPESRKVLIVGGAISGFTGGLIGLQGAVRSAFLISAKVSKETYIATSAAIAVMVDITRISVYVYRGALEGQYYVYVIPLAALAFFGVYVGKKLLTKLGGSIFKRIVLASLIGSAVTMLFS